MTREGLLKENIDGEALLWANGRLEKQIAKRKILYVLSDGEPVDDSTLKANPRNFLAKHLSAVAMSIEQAKVVELRAVGLDYENSFYSVSENVGSSTFGVPILEYVFNASYRAAMRMEAIKDEVKRP